MRKVALPVLAVALAVTLGACQNQSSTDEAAELCTALTSFNAAALQLGAMGPTSTIEEYQAAVSNATAAAADVKGHAGDLHKARADELSAAWDTYTSAVGDISDEATLRQASAGVATASAALRAQVDSIYSQVGCKPALPQQ